MTDSPSAAELRRAKLVHLGMPYAEAVRSEPHLDGSTAPASGPTAGTSAVPAGLAAAASDPANTAQLEASATGGDDSAGARFVALSADAMASLPDREFKAGLAAAKAAGLL